MFEAIPFMCTQQPASYEKNIYEKLKKTIRAQGVSKNRKFNAMFLRKSKDRMT